MAGAALLLLLVAAVGWVLRPPSLAVSRQLEPVRVRRGSPALGLVRIRNTGRRRAPGLTVEDRAGDRSVALDVPALRPGQEFASTYRLPTDRRGIFDVGPLVLAQTDPFGLLARRRPFGEAARLWVHPRSHPVPAARSGADHRDGRPHGRHRPGGHHRLPGPAPLHRRGRPAHGALADHGAYRHPHGQEARRHQPASGGGAPRRSGRPATRPAARLRGGAFEVAASLWNRRCEPAPRCAWIRSAGPSPASCPTGPGTPSTSWPDSSCRTRASWNGPSCGSRWRREEARRCWSAVTTFAMTPAASTGWPAATAGSAPCWSARAAPVGSPAGPAPGVPGGRGRGRAGPLAVRRPGMITGAVNLRTWGRYIPAIPAGLTVMAAGWGFPAGLHLARYGRRRWRSPPSSGAGAGRGGAPGPDRNLWRATGVGGRPGSRDRRPGRFGAGGRAGPAAGFNPASLTILPPGRGAVVAAVLPSVAVTAAAFASPGASSAGAALARGVGALAGGWSSDPHDQRPGAADPRPAARWRPAW